MYNILVRLQNTDNSVIPPGHKLSQLDFNYYGGLYRHVLLIKKCNQYRLHRTIRIDYEKVTKSQAILIVHFQIIANTTDLKDCLIRFSLDNYEIFLILIEQNFLSRILVFGHRQNLIFTIFLLNFLIDKLSSTNKQ